MSTAELVTKLQAEVDQLQDQLHSPASHHEDEHNVEMMGDDQSGNLYIINQLFSVCM